jgi:cobyrinic acid a,c-diamide synthase
MCLFDSLITLDGFAHPMWGLFAGRVIMQERLMALGPQEMLLQHACLRGHTYHHSRCETTLVPAGHTRAASVTASSAARGEAIYVAGNIRGSYFHAYFNSSLPATARLFQPGAIA